MRAADKRSQYWLSYRKILKLNPVALGIGTLHVELRRQRKVSRKSARARRIPPPTDTYAPNLMGLFTPFIVKGTEPLQDPGDLNPPRESSELVWLECRTVAPGTWVNWQMYARKPAALEDPSAGKVRRLRNEGGID